MPYTKNSNFRNAATGTIPDGWLNITAAFSIAGTSGNRYSTANNDFAVLLAPDAVTPTNRASFANGDVYALPGATNAGVILCSCVSSGDTISATANYGLWLIIDAGNPSNSSITLLRSGTTPATLSGYVIGEVVGLRKRDAVISLCRFAYSDVYDGSGNLTTAALNGTVTPTAKTDYTDSSPLPAGAWGQSFYISGSAATLSVVEYVSSGGSATGNNPAIEWEGHTKVFVNLASATATGHTYDVLYNTSNTSVGATVAATNVTAWPYAITGLTPGTSGTNYYVFIRANKSGQTSVTSAGVACRTYGTTQKVYAANGDSIVVGYGTSGGMATAKAQMIAAIVSVHGQTIRQFAPHYGVFSPEGLGCYSGSNARQWASDFASGGTNGAPNTGYAGKTTAFIAACIAREIDIVVSNSGVNDSWHYDFDGTLLTPQTQSQMQATYTTLAARFTSQGLTFIQQSPTDFLPPVYEQPSGSGHYTFDSTSLAAVRTYPAAIVAAVAADTSGLFKAGNTAQNNYFQTHSSQTLEGLHPNDMGAVNLGAFWADGLFPPASVTVSPPAPTIPGMGTQQFTAGVTGTNSPAQTVTWDKVSGVGTINATTGLYTAPASISTAQTAVIRATSTVDTSKSGTATVTIQAAVPPALTGITVTIDAPANDGTRQAHAAPVPSGANIGTVVWTQTGGGSITSSGGLSTPPAQTTSAQTVTVTATSSSVTGSATYTVAASSGGGGTGGLTTEQANQLAALFSTIEFVNGIWRFKASAFSATEPTYDPYSVETWNITADAKTQLLASSEYQIIRVSAQRADGGFLSPSEVAAIGLEIAFMTGSALPVDADYHPLEVNLSGTAYPYVNAKIRVGAGGTVTGLGSGVYQRFVRVVATPHVVEKVSTFTLS